MVLILGYADDIDIIGKSKAVVEEAFHVLDDAARKLGLVINANKTRYMIAGQERGFNEDFVQIGHYSFERVEEFVYLGSQVNATNDVSAEIRRISSANRCFFLDFVGTLVVAHYKDPRKLDCTKH
nr:uncharacterized protein LOC106685086 [Halyomorpha halys]